MRRKLPMTSLELKVKPKRSPTPTSSFRPASSLR
ncbi:hypothetical protein BC937DRAFT_93889 [Endogone sp. FLAS-F59071]|nr:hypothetical protein BC937DRAFT_93889 [Endogone sp. FLAS-F59071]|eukprot:RUS20998.1 hypothetical protein BC937DRAFT_93889 [Endogone sp. FLAS-F59071]